MGYNLPMPPGLSKEEVAKWRKREERYLRQMSIMMGIAMGLFLLLVITCAVAYYFKK
jgi:hypothetical protein